MQFKYELQHFMKIRKVSVIKIVIAEKMNNFLIFLYELCACLKAMFPLILSLVEFNYGEKLAFLIFCEVEGGCLSKTVHRNYSTCNLFYR